MATLLPSLPSDDEDPVIEDEKDESDDEMDTSFEFGGILGEDGGGFLQGSSDGWSYQTALANLQQTDSKSSSVPRLNVNALISAKRRTLQKAREDSKEKDESDKQQNEANEKDSDSDSESGSSSDGDSSSSDDESEDGQVDDADKDLDEDVLRTREKKESKKKKIQKKYTENDELNDSRDDDEESEGDESVEDEDESSDDEEENIKAAAFFESEKGHDEEVEVFNQFSLSRPLLRGVASMGFTKPTPIQASVIPLALTGRDICASAVTGSGKTAAFLLPILERLLHRYTGRIKAVILTPTRELAAQCLGMLTTFAQFTKLRACLIVGGSKNLNAQAAELRTRPEIVVATPGRLLDHVTNSAGVALDEVEFLILDEADRLLDLGFQEEVGELVKSCPINRQTLLFSATMNTKVDDLIKLSLKRPVRVRISDKEKDKDIEVAPRLEQEFVRIRASNEGINREAMLLALLTRTFSKQAIVFFDTKASAHRLMIICGLCGIKCTELHGNLTQQQRLTALEDFRNGHVDILLATDLAARGLDVDRVETVINFEMPAQLETYVHRIGRTARAGRGGRSCTLIGEGRRHLMKQVIKDAETKSAKKSPGKEKRKFESGVIRTRAIPPAVVSHFAAKIQSLAPSIDEIVQAEAVARMDRIAEMEALRAQNIIEHGNEIRSRPQREWFASNKDKKMTKAAIAERQKMIKEKAGTGVHRMNRKKRRAREALEAFNEANAEDDAEGPARKGPVKQGQIKSEARKLKRERAEKEHEAFMEGVSANESRKKKTRKKALDSAGDSSLFEDEKVSFAPKKSKSDDTASSRTVKSAYNFRGYDPSRSFGKKKGHSKFKSKAKYKRRK